MDAETFTKVNCHASPTLARYFERDNEILYHTSPTIAAKSARSHECLATRIDRELIDVLSDLLILRDIPDPPTMTLVCRQAVPGTTVGAKAAERHHRELAAPLQRRLDGWLRRPRWVTDQHRTNLQPGELVNPMLPSLVPLGI